MQEREVTFSPGKKSLTTVKHLKNTYPQYQIQNYLEKIFGGRMESWALFSRIERELPTHDSNTTAYAEISMRLQKKLSVSLKDEKSEPA